MTDGFAATVDLLENFIVIGTTIVSVDQVTRANLTKQIAFDAVTYSVEEDCNLKLVASDVETKIVLFQTLV